jgi:hypothetical protein
VFEYSLPWVGSRSRSSSLRWHGGFRGDIFQHHSWWLVVVLFVSLGQGPPPDREFSREVKETEIEPFALILDDASGMFQAWPAQSPDDTNRSGNPDAPTPSFPGYVSFWYNYDDELLYYYPVLLQNRTEIIESLVDVAEQFPLDVSAAVARADWIERLFWSAVEKGNRPRAWVVATRYDLFTLMGFELEPTELNQMPIRIRRKGGVSAKCNSPVDEPEFPTAKLRVEGGRESITPSQLAGDVIDAAISTSLCHVAPCPSCCIGSCCFNPCCSDPCSCNPCCVDPCGSDCDDRCECSPGHPCCVDPNGQACDDLCNGDACCIDPSSQACSNQCGTDACCIEPDSQACFDQCGGRACCIDPNSPACDEECGGDACCIDPCSCDPCCNNTDPCDPTCGDPCASECVNCDDSNACTDDSCSGGVCSHVSNCTGNTICCDGACLNCDDGDPCTIGSCDPSTGSCVYSDKCDDTETCCTTLNNPDAFSCCKTCETCCGGACCGYRESCCDGQCCPSGWGCCVDGTGCCPDGVAAVAGFVAVADTCNGATCNADEVCCDDVCTLTDCSVTLDPVPVGDEILCPGDSLDLTGTAFCLPDCVDPVEMNLSARVVEQDLRQWVTLTVTPSSATCGPTPTPVTVRVVISPDAPGGAPTIELEGAILGGASCGEICIDSDSTQLTISVITIDGEVIDQDVASNTVWAALGDGSPVYGGSEASTADNFRLKITPELGIVTDILWSTEGTGSATWSPAPTGPAATEWDLGDLLDPIAGDITFKVRVTYANGNVECGKFSSEIGIRTDDVTVVGWIDPARVTLPAGPIPVWITSILPPAGPPVPSSFNCNDLIFDLSENDINPNGNTLFPADRSYILHWMFKYAGNTDPTQLIPGGNFRNPADTQLDSGEVAAYVGVSTNYKLFSRLQIRYLADTVGFTAAPEILQAMTSLGSTTNPCGAFWPAPGILDSQVGPNNGPPANLGPRTVSMINDGSPDAGAIRAFNTLTGNGVTPALFWENIGSSIRFRFDSGTGPAAVVLQPYPTYYVYRNGKLDAVTPQAASPTGNFVTNPYPFGTVPCGGVLFPGITPGGRCGDAVSPADLSARTPNYIVVPQ